VGPFTEKNTISLDYAAEMGHDPHVLVHSLEAVLDGILALPVTQEQAWRLHQGQALPAAGIGNSGLILCTFQGQAVALGRCEKETIIPFCVFNHSREKGDPSRCR
jgi:hypothetical protein